MGNKRLNKNLVSIFKGQGLLRKMEENAQSERNKKNMTLINEFRVRE